MIPALIKVRQELKAPELKDPVYELKQKLGKYSGKVKPGEKVAIAVGSRGIQNGAELVKTLVQWVKAQKGLAFIIPAMGSHGASTSIGQKRVLEELGLSEKNIGVPICSEIDAIEIGELEGIKIYTDQFALKAEHLILFNRIKPHTSFHGRYESGLCKMLAVGLGKRKGAEELHKFGPKLLAELIPKVAQFLLRRLPVFFGVAILENYQEHIASMELIPAREFLTKEPELLKQARELLPRLPFSELEVLIVDELGKDKSGTGMDTNVIGRLDLRGMPEPEEPRIKRIVVLGLSKKTRGSGYGIGLADITTKRVIKLLDLKAMRENALASTFLERVRLPVWFDSDRLAIESALKTCWCPEPKQARVCRIKSTLELEQFWITENLLSQSLVKLKVLSKAQALKFDRQGNLLPYKN